MPHSIITRGLGSQRIITRGYAASVVVLTPIVAVAAASPLTVTAPEVSVTTNLIVAERDVSVDEVLPLGIDFVNLATGGQTLSGAAAQLIEVLTGTAYAASVGAASISGTEVRATVTCAALLPTRKYRLELSALLSGGARLERAWLLRVVW